MFRRKNALTGLAVLLVTAGAARAAAQTTAPEPPKAGAATPQQDATSPKVVERSARGPTARNIQVGLYLNVQPDCTSGTLPALRLIAPPHNGTVSIKRGKASATNYKQCLALEVPAFVAFYQSKPGFTGHDEVTIEVKYPAGRTELQRISIDVGGNGVVPALPKAPQGQKI